MRALARGARGARGEDAFGRRSAFLELVGLAEVLDSRRHAPQRGVGARADATVGSVSAGAVLRSGASSGTGASAAVRGVAGRGTGSTVVAPRPGVGRRAAGRGVGADVARPVASEGPLAEAEPALGTPASEARGTADPSDAIPARPPTAVRKTDPPRDGTRRIVELLRARGVDAALEGYVARRARWPEADLAKRAGEAGDDGLERLRDAVALRGLPPLCPNP